MVLISDSQVVRIFALEVVFIWSTAALMATLIDCMPWPLAVSMTVEFDDLFFDRFYQG